MYVCECMYSIACVYCIFMVFEMIDRIKYPEEWQVLFNSIKRF